VYTSATVTAKVERAEKITRDLHIIHTPTLIINGKYLVDLESAGGDTYFLAIAQDLAAMERHL
jgi:protein-disulfide isomerase